MEGVEMRVKFTGRWIILISMLLIMGCAPVISKPLRDQVDNNLTFRDVFKDPDGHKGRVVVWAGVIIEAKNTKEGTLIEILQRPADFFGAPEEVDRSEGRFLALYSSYLDIAVYAKGREVTVGGEVEGKRIMPLGEIQYPYPLLLAKEIYLWPDTSKERLAPYPYPVYPWWWYDPFWRPWYYPYPYERFRHKR
jgi:outer membrane lipoprotein